VTNDPVPVLAQFAREEKVRFTLLSDKAAEIIGAFDLVNERFRGTRWDGVAHPATFVVDARGVVTHRFSESSYRDRPDVDAVLEILKSDVLDK
jgi:peroxiredoxin